MSRIIHCGWCGEAGHRINHCKSHSMEELYNRHKLNGRCHYDLTLSTNEKLQMYVLSTSTYSLKKIKAISAYMGVKNISSLARLQLANIICIEIFNELHDIINVPKVSFTMTPLVNMCCQVIDTKPATNCDVDAILMSILMRDKAKDEAKDEVNDEANDEVNDEAKDEAEELSDCCICFENLTSDKFVKFDCKHDTCIDCFKELVKCKTTTSHFPTTISRSRSHINVKYKCYYVKCPMCRSQINTIYSENNILSDLKNEHINNLNAQKRMYLMLVEMHKNQRHITS